MRYEETVFVRELNNNGNGLLRVLVSPGLGVLAISEYLMMMYLGACIERGADLGLADTGLGLSGSGSDDGGHRAPEGGASGPGP